MIQKDTESVMILVNDDMFSNDTERYRNGTDTS